MLLDQNKWIYSLILSLKYYEEIHSKVNHRLVANTYQTIIWVFDKEWKMDWLHSKMFGLVDIDAISCKKVQIKIRNIHTKNNWHNHVPISHSLQNPFSPFMRISIHHFRVHNNFNNAVFVLWDPIMRTHDLTRSLKIIFHTMIEDLNDKLYYVEADFAKS